MALMIDLVTPAERGGAMSTYGIGMDIGIGLGSMILGTVVESFGFGAAFGLAAAVPLASVGGVSVCPGQTRWAT